MDDDYNFEDFEYEPEEILNNLGSLKNKNLIISKDKPKEKNLLNKNKLSQIFDDDSSSHAPEVLITKQKVEDYGGFEVEDDENLEDLEDVKLEDIYSNRRNEKINEEIKENKIETETKDKHTNISMISSKSSPQRIKITTNGSYINTNSNPNLLINKEHEYQYEKTDQPKATIEDLNSISAILPQNSRLPVNNENSIFLSRLADVKGNNGHVISRMQMAEKNYQNLKSDLNKLITEVNSNNYKQKSFEQISKENLDLIKYLDKMSNIINVIIDSSKVPMKNPNFTKKAALKKNQGTANNSTNNNKLLDVYKKENVKLETRLKQVADPNYDEYLYDTLNELDNQITFYEYENKKLKNSQKQSEFHFERQFKNNVESNAELKKINNDYENIKRINEVTLEKVQKTKSQISDNEHRINELNEWNSKLYTIARDMYDIKDFNYYKEEEISEKKIQSRKQTLKKKMDVFERAMISNKRKYEGEISRNDKSTINLEKNKIEIMKVLKEKTYHAQKIQDKVKGIYIKYQDNNLISPDVLNVNFETVSNKVFDKTNNNSNSDAINIIDGYNTNKSVVEQQSEFGKKDTTDELDKKGTNEKIVDKVEDTPLNINKTQNNDKSNSRLFKPNFKFNTVGLLNTENPKETNESSLIKNNSIFINNEKIEKEKKSSGTGTNDDINKIYTKENNTNISLLNNSRRKNQIIVNSLNTSAIISNAEKDNTKISNTENFNNKHISPKNTNLPLFLQDFQKKNEEAGNSILINKSINNNVINNNVIDNPRRNRQDSVIILNNINSPHDNTVNNLHKKANSIFDLDEKFKNSNNHVNKIKLSDSIDEIDLNDDKVLDKKKIEEFDNLFKDDVVEIKNNNDNNNNLSSIGRNRDNLLTKFGSNVINVSLPIRAVTIKEKPKDVLDELEEIVL